MNTLFPYTTLFRSVGANPNLGWRWAFAVGFFPALLVFVIRLFVREPERWQQARAIGEKLGSFAELFRDPRWRRHTLIGVGLAAVGVIGFWASAPGRPNCSSRR